MNENPPIDLVSAALVDCQGKIKTASMDAKNPAFNSRYATLGAVIEATREALHTSGLAIQQITDIRDGFVIVHTVIRHKSGQFLDGGTMSLEIGESTRNSEAQVAGSIMTYLKRYSWASNLGVYADEDDDGNSAPQRAPGAVPRRQTPTPAPLTRPTPQNAPQTPPAPQTAHPVATERHRMKALNVLQAAPGQPNRTMITHYLMSRGWISGTQEPEAWPLAEVPASAEDMAKLVEAVSRFEAESKGVTP